MIYSSKTFLFKCSTLIYKELYLFGISLNKRYTIFQRKRLRDSILLSVFSSHIFARYKNAALWI